METLVIAAAFLKKDKIMETITNMDPFINIHENEGIFYYRLIIMLKILFANYSTISNLPKAGTISYLFLVNFCFIFVNPVNPFRLLTSLLLIGSGVWYLCGMGTRLELPTALTCMLCMNLKSYELILDLHVLFCVAYYACQAYSREYQKLATLIFLMVSTGWCLSTETRPFSSKDAVLLICYLMVIYYPLIPNPTTKYRHRLLCFYVVMLVWVLYKIHRTSSIVETNPQYVDTKMMVLETADTQCHRDEFPGTAVEYTNEFVGVCNANMVIEINDKYESVLREIYEPPFEEFASSESRIKGIKWFGPNILEENDTMIEWEDYD